MKKFLSLALALVMCLSLVTISAGATEFKDLTDVDEIEHAEAVELFNKIGIIAGYEDGSFGPEKTITREQAAKIIAIMALGNDAASKLGVEKAPFPDVPATSQFAGYIGYCVSTGIIDGYKDGTFKPKGTLTGYQFAKMLLGVIGYGVKDEYVGTNWALNVARDGASIGLFDDATVTAGLINRDNAAQVAFNALTSSLVTYSELLGTYVAYNLMDQTLLGTLAYNIFGLTTTGKVDNYGYNVHAWKQEGKIITEYYLTDEIIETITDPSITKGNLYKSYDWEDSIEVWENGDPKSNIAISSWKGVADKYLMNGYTVYLVDEPERDGTFDGDVDKIIVVKEYLAKVDKVNAATSSVDRSVDLTVYTATGEKKFTRVETEDFEKDDYILAVPNDSEGVNNFKYPLSLSAAESVEGMVSAYYKNTNATANATVLPSPNGSASMDGVKYEYNFIFRSTNALGQDLAVDGYSLNKGTYAFYLDSNGYVAGAKEVESAIKDYAYIISKGHDAFSVYNVAKVLLSDGTVKTLTVSDKSDKYAYETTATTANFDAHEGRIFAYSINDANELVLTDFNRARYEQVSSAEKGAQDMYDNASGVKQAPYINTTDGTTVGQIVANGFTKGYSMIQYTTDQTSVNGSGSAKYAYATDETVFLYYDASNNGKVTMFTGKANAPTVKNSVAASIVVRNSKADGTGTDYAEIVVILSAPENAYSSNYFYVLEQLGYSKVGDDNIYYYDVVKNGEKTRIAVDAGNLPNFGMYYYNYNESKFNGDSVYGTEPGVYEANATNSKLTESIYNTAGNNATGVATDKDYATLSNVYVNPNGNVVVGSNGVAGTQFLYGDATIVDVTSYVQNQADKEVVTGAALKSGMDITVVYAVENNLRIAKTIFITDNKEAVGPVAPPTTGVTGLNETYSIALTGANYGTMTVTDRIGYGEDGAALIRTQLTDAGYTVNQISNAGPDAYIADVTTANNVARTLNITVTNAYAVTVTIAGTAAPKVISVGGAALADGNVTVYADGTTGVVFTAEGSGSIAATLNTTGITYTSNTLTATQAGSVTLTIS